MIKLLLKIGVGCVLFVMIVSLFYQPFVYRQENISVSIYYKDMQTILDLEPYANLEAALVHIKVDDDVDYRKLNLQKVLNHNDVVVIPTIEDTPCISLNTSTLKELTQLSGVGNALAERIIAYRNENGYYQEIDDIKLVKGIGDVMFQKLREYVCL